MKRLIPFCLLVLAIQVAGAQIVCDPAGNIMIYSNYDGGNLNIDVDIDIPDLKIGITTYEFTNVTISGAFVDNVTEVVFAGFNAPSISGVDPAIVTEYAAAIGDVAITSFLGDDFFGTPIVNCMVGAEGCGETADGGGNSSPQIVQFFLSYWDDDDVFYAHYTDYGTFPGAAFQVSEGGNCCFSEPLTEPNPIYVEPADYDFFGIDSALLCTTDTTLDISFYPVVWGLPVWSTGATGYSIDIDEPGVYYFTVGDYCHYGSNLLSDTLIIEPCATVIDTAICAGTSVTFPDGSVVSDAGTYEIILTAADGSDSIITYELSLIDPINVDIAENICAGSEYVFPDGTSTDAAGSYVFSFTAATGCDSIVTYTITLTDTAFATLDASFCPGSVYTFPDGSSTTDAGVYDINLTAVSGCDSLLTVNLTISDTTEVLAAGLICAGDTYTLEDGTVVDAAGVYEALVFPPAEPCVTRFITTLEEVDTIFALETGTFCPGTAYVLPDGSSTTDPGVYTFSYTSAAGCDSLLTLTLSLTDTVEVAVSAVICEGDTYTLEDGTVVNTAGEYEVLVFPPAEDCITRYITALAVEAPVSVVMDAPQTVCIDIPSIALNAIPSGGVFTGPGVSGTAFIPGNAGVGGPYVITYTYTSPAGCISSATTSFTVTENYAAAGSDVNIIIGESVVLNVFTEGSPVWSPGESLSCTECFSPVATPLSTTTYTVTSIDAGGCVATDNVTVFVNTNPDFDYFIPNSFTPNGDGVNDYFTAYSTSLEVIERFIIYDRWGSVVFERDNVEPGNLLAGWDGRKNGELLQPGVYAYTMQLRFFGNFVRTASGNVTLMR